MRSAGGWPGRPGDTATPTKPPWPHSPAGSKTWTALSASPRRRMPSQAVMERISLRHVDDFAIRRWQTVIPFGATCSSELIAKRGSRPQDTCSAGPGLWSRGSEPGIGRSWRTPRCPRRPSRFLPAAAGARPRPEPNSAAEPRTERAAMGIVYRGRQAPQIVSQSPVREASTPCAARPSGLGFSLPANHYLGIGGS